MTPRFDISEWVEASEPDPTYFEPVELDYPEQGYFGRRVMWKGQPGVMMRIDADMVTATPGNPFNAEYLRYLVELIELSDEPLVLEAPAGRVHQLTRSAVEESQQIFDEDEDDLLGMTRPWEESDIGQWYFHPLDGNHRAFAAIYAGEPYIWVYVGENYREDAQEYLE